MAATMSAPLLDPTKHAKFPLSISEQLLREDGPRKRRKVNVQRENQLSSCSMIIANR